MEIRESYRWRSRSPGDGGQRSLLTRRTLLGFGLTALVQGEEPELSSFDLSLLDEPAVPNELFFVREHFPQPRVSAAGWKLSITGAVSKPCELSLDEISSAPRKVVPATLECAENQVGGGMVSHAEWAGATLASLIERAQPKSGAVSVRLSGADGFTRSIPITKAMHPDTLVAYGMNGEKLHAKHGLPLRAIVPGWYGMDSVKCLREIAVLSGAGWRCFKSVYPAHTIVAYRNSPGGCRHGNERQIRIFPPGRWSDSDQSSIYDTWSRLGWRKSYSSGGGEYRRGKHVARHYLDRAAGALLLGTVGIGVEDSWCRRTRIAGPSHGRSGSHATLSTSN